MSPVSLLLAALLQQHAPLDHLAVASGGLAPVFLGESTCGCAETCADAETCGDCACGGCAAPVRPPPDKQLMVVHGLRVVLPAAGLAWKAPIVDHLEEVSSLLQAGAEDGVGCCAKLEAESFSTVGSKDEADAEGNPLFTPDVLTGGKQLERIHAELARRGQTAYVMRSSISPAKLGVLLGQADASTGTMVVHREATGATWAHELGHLQGLGHYEDPRASGRLMYAYGDVAHPATALSCRDCDLLRGVSQKHVSLSSRLTHVSCGPAPAPAPGASISDTRRAAVDERQRERSPAIHGGCVVADAGPTGGGAGVVVLFAFIAFRRRRNVSVGKHQRSSRGPTSIRQLAHDHRHGAALAGWALLTACSDADARHEISVTGGAPDAAASPLPLNVVCDENEGPALDGACENARHSRTQFELYGGLPAILDGNSNTGGASVDREPRQGEIVAYLQTSTQYDGTCSQSIELWCVQQECARFLGGTFGNPDAPPGPQLGLLYRQCDQGMEAYLEDCANGESCFCSEHHSEERCAARLQLCELEVELCEGQRIPEVEQVYAAIDRCRIEGEASLNQRPPEMLSIHQGRPEGGLLVRQFASNNCRDRPGEGDFECGEPCSRGSCATEISFVWGPNQSDRRGHFSLADGDEDCRHGHDHCTRCFVTPAHGGAPQMWPVALGQLGPPVVPAMAAVVREDSRGLSPPPCDGRRAIDIWREHVRTCATAVERNLTATNPEADGARGVHTRGRFVPTVDRGGTPTELELGQLAPTGVRNWYFASDEGRPARPLELAAFAFCLARASEQLQTWRFDEDHDGLCDGVRCPSIDSPRGDPTVSASHRNYHESSEIVFSTDADPRATFRLVLKDVPEDVEPEITVEALPDGQFGDIEAMVVPIEGGVDGRTREYEVTYPRMPYHNSAFGRRRIEVCFPGAPEECQECRRGVRDCGVCRTQDIEIFWPLFERPWLGDGDSPLQRLTFGQFYEWVQEGIAEESLVMSPVRMGIQSGEYPPPPTSSRELPFARNSPGSVPQDDPLQGCTYDGAIHGVRPPNYFHYWQQVRLPWRLEFTLADAVAAERALLRFADGVEEAAALKSAGCRPDRPTGAGRNNVIIAGPRAGWVTSDAFQREHVVARSMGITHFFNAVLHELGHLGQWEFYTRSLLNRRFIRGEGLHGAEWSLTVFPRRPVNRGLDLDGDGRLVQFSVEGPNGTVGRIRTLADLHGCDLFGHPPAPAGVTAPLDGVRSIAPPVFCVGGSGDRRLDVLARDCADGISRLILSPGARADGQPYCFTELEAIDHLYRGVPTYLQYKATRPRGSPEGHLGYLLTNDAAVDELWRRLDGMKEHEAFYYERYLSVLPLSTYEITVSLAEQLAIRPVAPPAWVRYEANQVEHGEARLAAANAISQQPVDGRRTARESLWELDWGAPGRQHRTLGKSYD